MDGWPAYESMHVTTDKLRNPPSSDVTEGFVLKKTLSGFVLSCRKFPECLGHPGKSGSRSIQEEGIDRAMVEDDIIIGAFSPAHPITHSLTHRRVSSYPDTEL